MKWQPAILKRAGIHADTADYETEHAATKAREGMRIRVRPWAGNPSLFYCTDPGRWFEVHPEDASKQLGATDGGPFIVCEHNILTD